MQLQKKILNNGITVLFEKRDLPLVTVAIANRFGAAHETSEVKGIAHFIEHLVFTGTQSRTHEDTSREIEKKGGVLNAYTANEVTAFWFKLPSEHLFAGLTILSDMLINPAFKKDKFEKEKKVILEEIKMYHDMPQSHVYEKLEQNLFEAPFGEGVIGSEQTVSALERDFVYNYFKAHYSPEQYVVCVVGNADFDALCSYFEKEFSSGKRKDSIIPIRKKNGQSREERPGIDQAHYVFGIHAPLPGEATYSAFEVLDAYLASGMSSRLFLKIREERGLAYSVRSSLVSEKDYSYYAIYVGTTKAAVEEVQRLILEEFAAVKQMTEKDLAEAKQRLIGLRQVAAEDSTSVMNELLGYELVSGAEAYYSREEKVKAVRLEDVRAAAAFDSYSSAAIVPQ